MSRPLLCEADRLLDEGHDFTVCFCGRHVFDECDVCGYRAPRLRSSRLDDLLAEWKAAGHAATVKRQRRRRFRAVRRQRGKTRGR